ncbi:hypothetical protein HZA75_05960 [Candidatus Roizmanbacteria bacterium]|nr:hypothetical protein [Candidatus Roizmanbacteria bacterium]
MVTDRARLSEGSMGTPESLRDRTAGYLPSRELLEKYSVPDPISLSRKDIYQKKFPGANYSLVFSQTERRLVMVPPWHPLNTTSMTNHAGDYGTGLFEGGSMEPVSNGQEIIGANIILHEPRMNRLKKSLKGRLFDLPEGLDAFSQGIIDLATILGESVLRDENGSPSRAYIRPEARPGLGGLGISLKEGHQIDSAAIIFNWPVYFSDPEKVYHGSGLAVAAFPEQRLFRILGKHASNYGDAGRVGAMARSLNVDEALYFGPYLINSKTGEKTYINAQTSPEAVAQLLKDGVLADGPGEEVFAITKDRKILFPPMDVNRLGGTTLSYIVDYMAPKLRLLTEEKPFSLEDVRQGEIESLMFAGNASRIAPIGNIKVYHEGSDQIEELKLAISKGTQILLEEYEAEVRGQTPPSNQSLLTPVDLESGADARPILDEAYANWI